MRPLEGSTMRCLVTGGAGFIGRWVVRQLLDEPGQDVVVFDNFSNSTRANVAELEGRSSLHVVTGSVTDGTSLDALWSSRGPFDIVYHLAASIRVQDSIDRPRTTFDNDVVGTFEVLERCRRQYLHGNGLDPEAPFHLAEVSPRLQFRSPRVCFMSTCMVYEPSLTAEGIHEGHPVRPASPYGASKLAAEQLVLGYHRAYRLPAVIVRPFNTYGPFQKRNLEGGVVAIFVARDLAGQPLQVKGDGSQTRDLLFVEDCARFVVDAGTHAETDGEILNAGLGREISILDLARLVTAPATGGRCAPIERVAHDHPQAEIPRLLCDNRKAGRLLGWRPRVPLDEGIRRTREWIRAHPESI
jgi:UDP-glucose 4-epimerase